SANVHARETRPIIYDGHCLVDVGPQPIEIPIDVVRQLQPAGIVLVHAPADEIVRRRQGDTARERPSRDAAALAAQQARCVAICAGYGKQLGLDFVQVFAGNEHEFAQVVGRMLQT
ncbi:MAG: AAA family ATPase, partial [Acetobacteraceae bacterium]